jgi:hypothetical protein
VYDGLTGATVTLGDNRVAGDTLTISGTAAFLDKNVANGKTVNVSGIAVSGGDAGNYTYNTTTSTTADITPATITTSNTSGLNKVYDGTTALPSGSPGFSYSGVISGDTVTFSASGAAYGSKDVGDYTLTITGISLSGTDAGNYTLSSTSATSHGTISPRPATVTPTVDQGKVYGDPDPVLTYTTFNLVADDSISVNLSRQSGENAGSYAITLGAAGNSNYTVTVGNGTFTITPAVLTYTSNSANRIYGAVNPTLSGTVTGFKSGDTLASATTGTLVFTSDAPVTSNVGSYSINGGGLTASHGNYTFVQANGNAQTLTITKAPLTITADNESRNYGQENPSLTYTAQGFVSGQDVSVLKGFTLTTTATATSDPGNYPITLSGSSSNYAITFVDGTLTIKLPSIVIGGTTYQVIALNGTPVLSSSYAVVENNNHLSLVDLNGGPNQEAVEQQISRDLGQEMRHETNILPGATVMISYDQSVKSVIVSGIMGYESSYDVLGATSYEERKLKRFGGQ